MIYIAATHNENKIKEFDRILKPLGISVISAEECGENCQRLMKQARPCRKCRA